MSTFLHHRFYRNIHYFIKDPKSILIAISGGQDSTCLMYLLHNLLNIKYFKLEAIYIDHQWQKSSKKHIKHIMSLTKTINIKLYIYQIKSPVFSEMQARKLRYELLIKHALKYKYKYIATGHTENDKIETCLQNLFKGTTTDGLTSLKTIKIITQDLYIIRPMLNFQRQEVEWLCRKLYIPIWSDITNYNFSITRNRLRYELISYLRQYFNPNIENSLSNFLKIASNDNDYIKENCIKLYIKTKHKKFVAFNLLKLKRQHITLQIRTAKLFFQYHFNRSINNKTLHKILNLDRCKIKLFYTDQLMIQYKNQWIYANYAYNKIDKSLLIK